MQLSWCIYQTRIVKKDLKARIKIFGKKDATRKEIQLIKNNDQALTFP